MRNALLVPFLFFIFIIILPGSLLACWPVYWELDGQKNFFGPLISYEEEDGQVHLTVRPLLSSYDTPGNYSLLFPLGGGSAERSYFAPFYTRHRSEDASDVTLFPFFWGKTGERTYGGVFPFYGRLYNRFRRDEIGFFLWPLYSYSKGDGTTRTNVLWPFFSFSHGRQEGFKLGPFYGRWRWGDERRSSFVLWPFFIRDEKDLTTDNPKSSYWVVPFYMETTSPRYEFHAVLWPLFTSTKGPEKTEIGAPWPFYTHTTGKEERGTGMWPLYSRYWNGKDETTHVLWPVYAEREWYPGDMKWTQVRVLMINNYKVDNRGTFFNVWPFFEYRQAKEASVFYFPSLLPWRNVAFDRIMRPLMTLYEYRKEGGKTTANFLYGFYTKEEEGERWRRRLAFLLDVKREPEGLGFEVFSGLFGVDSRRIKICYIPLERKKGEVSPPADHGEGEGSSGPAATPDGP